MIKITCLVGSPRADGSCAFLIDAFMRGAEEGGAAVKRYSIGRMDIGYCLGCKRCYEDGVCVQRDDVKDFVDDMLGSDYVVMAAPSWWAGVPAQLKTLFDRTTPYGDTNPNRICRAEKPVRGVAIAVRAGAGEQENGLILDALQHYFGHLGIETVRRISICRTDSLTDLMMGHRGDIDAVYALGRQAAEGTVQ